MTDTKNTVSDELLADLIREAANEDLVLALTELQSLRASIPGDVGVKGLGWVQGAPESVYGQHSFEARPASNGIFVVRRLYSGDGWTYANKAYPTAEAAKAAAQADYERRIRSALDLSPAEGESVGLFRKTDGAWKQVPDEWADHPNVQPLYAAPSNPVISDELAEQVFQSVAPHIAGTDWREVRDAITAALSVKPQP